MKYLLIGLATMVTIGILGFMFWLFFINKPAEPEISNVPVIPSGAATDTPIVEPTPEPAPQETTGTTGIQLEPPVTEPPPGANVPPPTPIGQPEPVPEPPPQDTDSDGLTDQRERELGLDPANPDMDGDGLSDGQEVLTYNTNPTNPDTDGDTYNDGVEVQGGYNPRGSGMCSRPDCIATP